MLDKLDIILSIIDIIICIIDIGIMIYLFFYRFPQEQRRNKKFYSRLHKPKRAVILPRNFNKIKR